MSEGVKLIALNDKSLIYFNKNITMQHKIILISIYLGFLCWFIGNPSYSDDSQTLFSLKVSISDFLSP